MSTRKKLLVVVESFIEDKNASWNHKDWICLVEEVKSKGIKIKNNDLGAVLESERDKYNAKKHGIKIPMLD